MTFEKGPTLSDYLSWSHYVELLKFDDINTINYYINKSINKKLGVRELRYRIKIKNMNHDKTIGLIICKKDNNFVMEYCSDSRIYNTMYNLV